MTPLSPLDSLTPAFRRTREILVAPFRPGTFFKITFLAALTQPSFYSAFFTYPLQALQFAVLSSTGHRWNATGGERFVDLPGLAAFGVLAILIAVILVLVLWAVAAYLYCRLRFALFDLVVFRRGVRNAWRAYSRQAWRYFGLVILAALTSMVIAVVVAGPMLLNLVRTLRPLAAAGAAANPLPVIGAALPLMLAVLAVALLWAVIDALMQDFLLPAMAIEDAPIETAIKRLKDLLKSNPGSMCAYILLRFAVDIGMTWILMLGLFAGLLIAGLVLLATGVLMYHLLWSGFAGKVFCVSLALIAAILVLAIYLIAVVAVYGVVAVFKQSYAAYYFAGRYPRLAELLEPPTQIENRLQASVFPPGFDENLPPLNGAPPVW